VPESDTGTMAFKETVGQTLTAVFICVVVLKL